MFAYVHVILVYDHMVCLHLCAVYVYEWYPPNESIHSLTGRYVSCFYCFCLLVLTHCGFHQLPISQYCDGTIA